MSNRHKKNLDINSNWTAVVPIKGWKHYRIAAKKKQDGQVLLELMSICDRSVRFWVDSETLINSSDWQPGWL
tara:strand:+ start:611 stop:826 length:216 start_codon:yes stop_codon:yes gene_type:complete